MALQIYHRSQTNQTNAQNEGMSFSKLYQHKTFYKTVYPAPHLAVMPTSHLRCAVWGVKVIRITSCSMVRGRERQPL